MEFKERERINIRTLDWVDIGTEWNLKTATVELSAAVCRVDIGTEWNLKLSD